MNNRLDDQRIFSDIESYDFEVAMFKRLGLTPETHLYVPIRSIKKSLSDDPTLRRLFGYHIDLFQRITLLIFHRRTKITSTSDLALTAYLYALRHGDFDHESIRLAQMAAELVLTYTTEEAKLVRDLADEIMTEGS